LPARPKRELDDHAVAGLVELVRVPTDLLHHLVEGVEPAVDPFGTSIRVGLGGECGRRGGNELGVDQGQDPVDAALVERLEPSLDYLEVLAGHPVQPTPAGQLRGGEAAATAPRTKSSLARFSSGVGPRSIRSRASPWVPAL